MCVGPALTRHDCFGKSVCSRLAKKNLSLSLRAAERERERESALLRFARSTGPQASRASVIMEDFANSLRPIAATDGVVCLCSEVMACEATLQWPTTIHASRLYTTCDAVLHLQHCRHHEGMFQICFKQSASRAPSTPSTAAQAAWASSTQENRQLLRFCRQISPSFGVDMTK